MNTTALNEALLHIENEKKDFADVIKSIESLGEDLRREYGAMLDSCARVGRFVHEASAALAGSPQTRERIHQARNDARQLLGPMLAMDLCRELKDATELTGGLNFDDLAYIGLVTTWLSGVPIGDNVSTRMILNADAEDQLETRVFPDLPTMARIVRLFPEIVDTFKIGANARDRIESQGDAINDEEHGAPIDEDSSPEEPLQVDNAQNSESAEKQNEPENDPDEGFDLGGFDLINV